MIDTDGVEGVTARKLAKRLGVQAPSLYYHFPNKETILIAVAREIIRDLPTREPEEGSWQSWMIQTMLQYRRVLLKHPNALRLMAHLQLAGLVSDETWEHGAAVMEAGGVPPGWMLAITSATEMLVAGSVLSDVAKADLQSVTADGTARRRMTESNSFDDEQRFEMACVALIKGFEALLESAGSS